MLPVPFNVVWSEGGKTSSNTSSTVLSSSAWIPTNNDTKKNHASIFRIFSKKIHLLYIHSLRRAEGNTLSTFVIIISDMPPKNKKQMDRVMTPHLKAIITKHTSPDCDSTQDTLARASFMLQRKRDALNCYLRITCMRISGDMMAMGL